MNYLTYSSTHRGSENCGMRPEIQQAKYLYSGSLKLLEKGPGKEHLNGGKQKLQTV
jgi:hypothetical protein